MTKKFQKKGPSDGFTLIELLVVIAIIGIIASMVLIGLNSTRRLGRDARRIADLRQIQTLLEIYSNACGQYPPGGTGTNCTVADPWGMQGAAWGINQVPQDPLQGTGRLYIYDGCDGTTYVIQSELEDANNGVFSSYTAPAPSGCSGLPCTAPNYCVSI